MYGQLKDIVPKKFSSTEPLSSHKFIVIDPHGRLYEQIETIHGDIRNIEASAYCKIRTGNGEIPLLISYHNSPKLANTILSLAALPRNGNRKTKYRDLYQIYEGLQKHIEPNFAALRHALSHPPEILSNPRTVSHMNAVFGSVIIDLGNTKHERTFWKLFGELLVAVDILIGKLLAERRYEFIPPTEFKRIVNPAYFGWKEHNGTIA